MSVSSTFCRSVSTDPLGVGTATGEHEGGGNDEPLGESNLHHASDPSPSAPMTKPCQTFPSFREVDSWVLPGVTHRDRERDRPIAVEERRRPWPRCRKSYGDSRGRLEEHHHRVKVEAKEDDVTLMAAGVAFYSLMALVPGLVALISIYGLVAKPSDVKDQITSTLSAAPREVRDLVTAQLQSMCRQRVAVQSSA